MTDTEVHKPIVVNYNAGPAGVGDPNDKRLRKIEKDVLIKNRVRDAAKAKCWDEMMAFNDCVRDNFIITVPFKCNVENNIQTACLLKWIYDPELNKKVTEQYLEQRTQYRLTGKPVRNT